MLGRAAVLAVCLLTSVLAAPPAWAEPEPEPPPADAAPVADTAAPPAPEGVVPSSPPATTKTPDGWTLTVSAKDEIQQPTAPLTTALSTREYVVGGVFTGSLDRPEGSDEDAHGTLEVGYEIGCGIDMSTSNGVTLSGSAGVTAGFGITSVGPIPTLLAPVSGGVSVALKPGIVNIVPVSKKEFKGEKPWVMISGFRIKIDGCVGQSFIRSFAHLTKSNDVSDAIQSYYGVTKTV